MKKSCITVTHCSCNAFVQTMQYMYIGKLYQYSEIIIDAKKNVPGKI